jgi:sugar-specific transcriptional regulator TrmB
MSDQKNKEILIKMENLLGQLDVKALEKLQNILNLKSGEIPDSNWRLHTLLKRLGLNKYEIKAYIALVQGGTQTASEIVKKTGIPQPRIYDTLSTLLNYGLLEQRVESDKKKTTRRFRAENPEMGIENLFSFFAYAKDQALLDLQKISQTRREFSSGIWEVHTKPNIIMTLKSLIKKAKFELLIVSKINVLLQIEKELLSAAKLNKTISCITHFTDEVSSEKALEWSESFKIKQRKAFSMPYIIVDRSQALQWGLNTLDHDFDPKYAIAQVIEQPALIATLIDHFFFSNWLLGRPPIIISTRDTIKPVSKTFIHIQSALEEIEYLIQRNRTPRARINCFSTTDPSKEVDIEGKVSKIDKKWNSGKFTIFIQSKDSNKDISVGGIRAQYEDYAAEKITVYLEE